MTMNAMGIIFSNMHNDKLHELTARRTMASVPFGGRYRLIDFVLSNMYNSGITKVGVITKNNYQSLIDHLGSGKEWDLSHKREGLYILPPFSGSVMGVYKGRIEALAGISEFFRRSAYDNVILADCDVVCNMDFNGLVQFHNESRADITAVYKRRALKSEADRDAITYEADGTGRVTAVTIAPQTGGEVKAGLNMWVVRKSFLEHIIAQAVSNGEENWERDILQKKHNSFRLFAWEFDGYSAQIASIDDYFRANTDLLTNDIRHELFYKYGHIYTKIRDEVPAKYGNCSSVKNSLVADGCVIEGTVEDSILFRGVHVGKGAHVHSSIIMQGSTVGNDTTLNFAIIDKDVVIKDNRTLMGYDTYPLFINKGSVV
jgi:glucose-1-phosphate adenylyltransferase